jgi:amino acid adenylation domain-containing protein
MDPEFPQARVANILADAGSTCPVVLVELDHYALNVPWEYSGVVARASRKGLVALGEDGGTCAHLCPAGEVPLLVAPRSTQLVYCMYTSGTTGKPKGVMVDHRSLSMRIDWFQTSFQLNIDDTVLFKTPYIFGVSEWELFWPLTAGAGVVIASAAVVKSVIALANVLDATRCTHAFFVPSHLKAMVQFWDMSTGGSQSTAEKRTVPVGLKPSDDGLRWVGACGEVLQPETSRDFLRIAPHAQMFNFYGPTEGSITFRQCQKDDRLDSGSLIGRPIGNTTIFLFDRHHRLVPVGTPGEVYFGSCIACGYLGQEELTSKYFVRNSISRDLLHADMPSSPMLYRTGDMAVWLPSGELRYLGRVDRQVKVRGYRIELGAVEMALRASAPVIRCASPHHGDGRSSEDSGRLMVAAVALKPSAERPGGELVGFVEALLDKEDEVALHRELSKHLPIYMIPTRLLGCSAFPKTATGKIDMRTLQNVALIGDFHSAGISSQTKTAPANGCEMNATLDSLGVIRRCIFGQSALAIEATISDNLRAFFMYGVIFDHWTGCSDGSVCSAVFEGMLWQQQQKLASTVRFAEIVLRAIGNYKCMSGFMMISAYQDSAYADSAHFTRTDVVVLLAYMQLLWVLDPAVWALCSQIVPETCTETVNRYAGVHRWYLLVVLVIKFVLVSLRVLHIPPIAQCSLVTIVAFVMPSEVGCLTDEKCAVMNDPIVWKDSYKTFHALWTLFATGLSEDSFNMFTSLGMRYYVLFMAQYMWTFFYGRSFVKCTVRFFRPAGGVKWLRACRHAAFIMFIFCEIVLAGIFGPRMYNYMQENAFGTFEPRFVEVSLVFLFLTAQVCILAFSVSGIRVRFRRLGSTTLGCYMIHMYFGFPLELVRPHFDAMATWGSAGFALQLALVLAVPLLFQATIGVWFHQLLMLEMRFIFHAWTYCCVSFAAVTGSYGGYQTTSPGLSGARLPRSFEKTNKQDHTQHL